MGLSSSYTTNPIPEEESIELLGEVLNQGINLIDTAAAYGTNEELLGKVIKNKINKIK